MQGSSFRIDMLGASFSIVANEEPSYLKEIADILYHKSEEVRLSTGLNEPLKIAIITGLLLCDELQKKEKNDPQAGSTSEENRAHQQIEKDLAETLALDLIQRLDLTLKKAEASAFSSDDLDT